MKPKAQGTCTQSFLMHYCIQSHQLGKLANTITLPKKCNLNKGASLHEESLTLHSTLPKPKKCMLHPGLKSGNENEMLPVQVNRHGKVS